MRESHNEKTMLVEELLFILISIEAEEAEGLVQVRMRQVPRVPWELRDSPSPTSHQTDSIRDLWVIQDEESRVRPGIRDRERLTLDDLTALDLENMDDVARLWVSPTLQERNVQGWGRELPLWKLRRMYQLLVFNRGEPMYEVFSSQDSVLRWESVPAGRLPRPQSSC